MAERWKWGVGLVALAGLAALVGWQSWRSRQHENQHAKDVRLKSLRVKHAQAAERACVTGASLWHQLEDVKDAYRAAGGDVNELQRASAEWLEGRAEDFKREAAINEKEGKADDARGVRALGVEVPGTGGPTAVKSGHMAQHVTPTTALLGRHRPWMAQPNSLNSTWPRHEGHFTVSPVTGPRWRHGGRCGVRRGM